MIAYSDLGTLDDEEQERVQSLFERSATIWDPPEDEMRSSLATLGASNKRGALPTLIAASTNPEAGPGASA